MSSNYHDLTGRQVDVSRSTINVDSDRKKYNMPKNCYYVDKRTALTKNNINFTLKTKLRVLSSKLIYTEPLFHQQG